MPYIFHLNINSKLHEKFNIRHLKSFNLYLEKVVRNNYNPRILEFSNIDKRFWSRIVHHSCPYFISYMIGIHHLFLWINYLMWVKRLTFEWKKVDKFQMYPFVFFSVHNHFCFLTKVIEKHEKPNCKLSQILIVNHPKTVIYISNSDNYTTTMEIIVNISCHFLYLNK